MFHLAKLSSRASTLRTASSLRQRNKSRSLFSSMPPKRKATSPVRPSPSKKQQTGNSQYDFDHSRIAERYGIIQRDFYPPEMSNKRCERYSKNEIPRPIAVLESTIKDTKKDREKIDIGKCVVHWFKRDLRLQDNTALSLASKKAE